MTSIYTPHGSVIKLSEYALYIADAHYSMVLPPSSLFVHIAQFHDKFHHAIHLNYASPTFVSILQVLLDTIDKHVNIPIASFGRLDEKRKSPIVETHPWRQLDASNIWPADFTVVTGLRGPNISRLTTHNHTAATREFL